jgi:hypothetical protein
VTSNGRDSQHYRGYSERGGENCGHLLVTRVGKGDSCTYRGRDAQNDKFLCSSIWLEEGGEQGEACQQACCCKDRINALPR